MRAIEAAAYWGIQVVNSYKNYTTEEMNLLLYNSSETVNDAELADKALFSIADHYNDTGYHMSPRTLDREQMKSRNSSDGSAEIFIDIPRCFKSSFYDSSYNLINSIKGHEVDGHINKCKSVGFKKYKETPPAQRELDAIEIQRKHRSWDKTTLKYKKQIEGYENNSRVKLMK